MGDEATMKAALQMQKSATTPGSQDKPQTAYRILHTYVHIVASASLLDQRRLVHLYLGMQHLPEMRNDGLINVSYVRVDLCEKNQVHKKKFEEIIEEGWAHTLSSVTFQSLIFAFGESFDHET